jgi:hypothetical protein
MENDTKKEDEVVEDENKDKPEELVRGSLLGALGVISPDEAAKLEEDVKPDDEEPVTDDKPAVDVNDALLDDLVDDKPAAVEEPEVVKISARDVRVKRKVKAVVVEPIVEPVVKAEPEPEPAPDLSHLNKRERDTLELVQFGEESGVADKGVADEVLKYYEARTELVKKLQAENDDDEDYDMSQDPALNRWKKRNPPPIDADSLDDIRNERITKNAEERAVKLMQPELDKARKELADHKRGIEIDKRRPTVEAKMLTFSDGVLNAMPEEVTSVSSKESDWGKVEAALPVEAPIVQRVLSKYADQAESLLNVVNGVTARDHSDPVQAEVKQFMFQQADILLSKGNTLRGGKEFVHPARFKKADEATTWTFSTDHVLQMLTKAAGNEAKREIKSEQKRFDAYNRTRGEQAAALKSAADEAPSSTSVKSSPAGDPGSTEGNAIKSLGGLFGL